MADDRAHMLLCRSAAATMLSGATSLAGSGTTAAHPRDPAFAARASARHAMWSVRARDVTRAWVMGEIAKIEAASPGCIDALIHDGTAGASGANGTP